MSLIKKLAGETAIYGLSSIIGRVLNYLLTPLFTEVFLPSEYGIVSHLYSWVAFLMVIFLYRMETAFFRYGTEQTDRQRTYSTSFWSILSTTLVFSLSIIIFSDELAQLLGYSEEQGVYVAIFGAVLGMDTLSEIPLARLRLENRPKRFAIVRLTNIFLNIFFNLFFLLYCPWVLEQGEGAFMFSFVEKIYSPSFGVGYIFLSNLIASAAMFILLLPEIRKVKWQFDTQLWRRMVLYSSPLILAGLAGIVNEVADRQLLMEYLPGSMEDRLGEQGIYSACYKLAMLMAMFTQAFRYAAEPFFFANAKHKDAKKIYAEVAKYFAIAGAFVFLVVTFYIDIFKHFLRDEAYWEGLAIVPVLLLANLFLGLYYNVSIWYKLTDHTRIGGWIALGGAATTIILNILWIPKYSYLGSAWATLICYSGMTLVSWWIGRKFYPVKYDLKKIVMYILLAISLYFVSNSIFTKFGLGDETLLLINTFLIIIYSFVAWKSENSSLQPTIQSGQDK